jgi:hypothetical protein
MPAHVGGPDDAAFCSAGTTGHRAAPTGGLRTEHRPLTTVCAAYPTPPFLPVLHPPIKLASWCPCGRLDVDRWVDNSAICFGKLLDILLAEIHI